MTKAVIKILINALVIAIMLWWVPDMLAMEGLAIPHFTFAQSFVIAYFISIVFMLFEPEPSRYIVDPSIDDIKSGSWVRIERVSANKMTLTKADAHLQSIIEKIVSN